MGKVGGTSKEKGVLDCFQKGTTALLARSLPTGASSSPLPAGNRYVHNLYNYLHSFIQRTQPLLNVEEILDGNVDGGEEGATKKAEAAFEALWQAGKLPGGWPVPAQGGGEEKGAENTKEVDLRGFRTAKELEVLGMDRLKAGLKALGMKCGGTLEERAARLFATKGKKKEEIDPKLLAGNGKKKSKAEGNGPTSNGNGQGVGTDKEGGKGGEDGKKQCARWEFRIDLLVKEVLREVVEATKKFVEKKQTRTKEETETELRQEEEGLLPELRGEGEEEDEDEEEEEDEDGPIYNPLNLPLGYDGKPIPYWLYKLHGLGVEYKCEICGNHSYWGRRAFDRYVTQGVLSSPSSLSRAFVLVLSEFILIVLLVTWLVQSGGGRDMPGARSRAVHLLLPSLSRGGGPTRTCGFSFLSCPVREASVVLSFLSRSLLFLASLQALPGVAACPWDALPENPQHKAFP